MRIHEVVNVEEAPLDIFKRGAAAAKAFMQKPQASAPATTANQVQPASQLKNGTKDSGYTYNAQTRKWVHPTQGVARGMLNRQLMNKYGANDSGEPLRQTIGQKISQKLGGPFAQGLDPKAGIAQKIGAKIGSALGRGVAALVRPKDADGDGQPDAAPQDANGDGKPDTPAPKPVPNIVQPELKALQSRTLRGDIKAAKELVNQLSDLKTKGFDVDNFIQAAAPAMKRGGLAKSDPQAYAHFTKLARSMRAESYEHLSRVLEAAGFTWEDVGYEVLVSESVTDYVMLVPVNEINVYEMKKLAGI